MLLRRALLVLLSTIALGQGAFAQSTSPAITGKLTDPDGGIVEGAPVQAKNTATGVMYKTISEAGGVYTFAQLPAGVYDLSIPTVGFTLDRFERPGLTIEAGKTMQLDVKLNWSFNLGTPGDDVSGLIRNLYRSIAGPAPRTPEGKPDLTGMWLSNDDPNPEMPAPQPWAAAIGKVREANFGREHPSGFCLPGFQFPTGPFLIRHVQTPTLLVQVADEGPSVRQIFLDGRKHPQDRDPSWRGHSTGTWDGDTLVVDTVGFNDKHWLMLYPQTELLHIVERYHRPDLAHLEVDTTVEDPGSLTKPWHVHATWNLAPGENIEEYICSENNKDAQHLSVK